MEEQQQGGANGIRQGIEHSKLELRKHNLCNYTDFHIVFWNTLGMNNFLESGFGPNKFSVIALTETWMENDLTLLPGFEDFQMVQSKAIRDASRGRASGGIVLLVKNSLNVRIIESTPWWIFAELEVESLRFIIGTLYLREKYDIDYYMEMLHDTLDTIESQYGDCGLIIGGDQNCRVGQLNMDLGDILDNSELENIRESRDERVNTRGRNLVNFMENRAMLLVNGRSKSDCPAQFTYCSGFSSSILDLVWVNLQMLENLVDLEVMVENENYVCLSDHFPVHVTLNRGESNDAEKMNISIQRSKRMFERMIYDSKKTQDYQRVMNDKLDSVEGLEVNQCNEYLVQSIKESSKELGMLRVLTIYSPPFRKGASKPWYDRDCSVAKKNINHALKNCKQKGFDDTSLVRYRSAKKEYQSIKNKKKREYDLEITEKLSHCHDSSSFWKTIKSFNGRKFTQCRVTSDKWEEYFRELYNEPIRAHPTIRDTTDPILDAPITLLEVRNALSKCKTGKTPGVIT